MGGFFYLSGPPIFDCLRPPWLVFRKLTHIPFYPQTTFRSMERTSGRLSRERGRLVTPRTWQHLGQFRTPCATSTSRRQPQRRSTDRGGSPQLKIEFRL